MNHNERASPLFNDVHYQPTEAEMKTAWWDGYRSGFNMDPKYNEYPMDSILWDEYETGYMAGYSDS